MNNFRRILLLWKDRHNGRFPREKNARMAAFAELFEDYKNAGYKPSDFTKSAMVEINDETVNPGHHNRSNLKKWARINAGYLETVFYKVFSEGGDLEKSDLMEPLGLENVKVDHKDQSGPKLVESAPKTSKVEHYADATIIDGKIVKKDSSRNTGTELPPLAVEFDSEIALLMGIKTK